MAQEGGRNIPALQARVDITLVRDKVLAAWLPSTDPDERFAKGRNRPGEAIQAGVNRCVVVIETLDVTGVDVSVQVNSSRSRSLTVVVHHFTPPLCRPNSSSNATILTSPIVNLVLQSERTRVPKFQSPAGTWRKSGLLAFSRG